MKHRLKWAFLFIIVALLTFVIATKNSSLIELFREIASWNERSPATFLSLFFGTYVLVTALSIPAASALTLIGGSVMGFWKALVVISFASSLGATLSFLLARTLLREKINQFINQRYANRLHLIQNELKDNGAFYLFTLRMTPIIPFFLVNILMALTPISTFTFYWVSQMGMLLGTALYVNAGARLSEINSTAQVMSPKIWISLTLLGITPLLLKWIFRVFKHFRILKKISKPKKFDYDVAIIGGGSAGLVAASVLRSIRAKVVLFEKDKMGGDCLNRGCVPSKTLIHAAKTIHQTRQSNRYLKRKIEPDIDFTKIKATIHEAIETIEPHDSFERFQKLGVTCHHTEARFISPFEIGFNDKKISARSIIVATGGRPLIPSISGIEQVSPLTSDTLWNLSNLPKRLVILGGGPMGCELAQTFQRLGSQVTIFENKDRLLATEDKNASQVIESVFAREGITLLTGTTVMRFEQQGNHRWIHFENKSSKNQKMEFDEIICTVGRKPHDHIPGIETLNLRKTQDGKTEVNDFLQSSLPHIYFAGDVSGGMQLTHLASHQAFVAGVNTLLSPYWLLKKNPEPLPSCIYTDPEIASVGFSELQCKERNIPFRTSTFFLSDLDRAVTDQAQDGFIKFLIAKKSDHILGASIVAPRAGEMISEITLAIKNRLKIGAIIRTIHPYPSYSDGLRSAATQLKKNLSQDSTITQNLLALLEWIHRLRRRS